MKYWVVLKCNQNEISCEHAGLKSQTGMSLFHLSCKRTLNVTKSNNIDVWRARITPLACSSADY